MWVQPDMNWCMLVIEPPPFQQQLLIVQNWIVSLIFGVSFFNICWNHHVGISQCFLCDHHIFNDDVVTGLFGSPDAERSPRRTLHLRWRSLRGILLGCCGRAPRGKHNCVLHKQHQWHTNQTKTQRYCFFFFFEALSQILKSENNSRLCTCSLIAAIPLCWIPDTSKWNLGKVRSRCKQLLQLKDFKDGKTPTGMPHKVLIDSISHTIHVWYIYLPLVEFYDKCRM